MDTYEATKMVFSRIQSLDPENASKIMGYILIQDHGEKEMTRLALGPETLLISLINQAKACLGFSSNSSSSPSTSSSPPFNPVSNPNRPNPFPQCSPGIMIPNNGFHVNHSSPSSPWSGSAISDHHISPRATSSLSYAAVVNGTTNNGGNNFPGSSGPSFSLPFFSNTTACSDHDSEYSSLQVQDNQLSFLDDSGWKNLDFIDPIMSPSGRSDSILFPYGTNAANWTDSGNCRDTHHHYLHRRSFSVSDVFHGGCSGAEDGFGGFGWRPCMYFARGFCKNGSSCKFLHGGFPDSPDWSGPIVGSPSKVDNFDELLRMKALQQQRFAAASQLIAGGPQPFPYDKCMNFLGDNQRSAAAALMMGEEIHKFGRCRSGRSDFAAMGLGECANSSSRQIYLTFPADSTFKEEDVSSYFSIYGPVQDVRIPYQQKRMFGFVTFIYPETVKTILAKGNPHFVCDSRVLVKPYKEKGKVPDKKQHHRQQQMDRGEFSACLSPSALDSREPYDIPFGRRMFYNTPEMMFRRKLEEKAELQQGIELEGRRFMNLQLMNLKNQQNNHQFQLNLSPGVPIPSPTCSHSQIHQRFVLHDNGVNNEVSEENKVSPDAATSPTVAVDFQAPQEVNEACNSRNGNDNVTGKEGCRNEDSDLHESLEHILPDHLFASPTKLAADHNTVFFTASGSEDSCLMTIAASSNNIPMLPTSSTLSMASLKSCYFQMPSH